MRLRLTEIMPSKVPEKGRPEDSLGILARLWEDAKRGIAAERDLVAIKRRSASDAPKTVRYSHD